MRALRFFVRRRSDFPGRVDFNRCKVLFIRQDKIGDVLVSTPLFRTLRQKYPGIILDIILSPQNVVAVRNNPHLRRRWIYDKRLISSLRMIRGLHRERYDFAVDLMDNPSATSTSFCLLAGARWNVGIAKSNDYSYDIVVPLLSRRDAHIVDRLAQLLAPFGIDPSVSPGPVEYHTSQAAETTVSGHWKSLGFEGKPVVGVNISAGGEVRYWGTENFRKLVSTFEAHHPEWRILILSKPKDRSRAEAIANGHSRAALPPETTFDEFAAFIARLSLLVTPDTSAVHLAAGYGVPTVALYVQSDPNLRIWEPYRIPHEAIVTPVDDLSTIDADKVCEAVERLIRTTQERKDT